MLFHSLTFAAFFIVVYSLYLGFRKSLRAQNWLLLAASYFFCRAWDWRFLGLIAFTTLTDYTVGFKLGATEHARRRKQWLLVSLVANLTVLGFFKYFNFLADSVVSLLNTMGMNADPQATRLTPTSDAWSRCIFCPTTHCS